MRALFMLLAVGLLVLGLSAVALLVRGAAAGLAGRRQPASGRETAPRWEAHHRSGDGRTVVMARRVERRSDGELVELETVTIAEIPDGVPDWNNRFHDAMAVARERAAALGVPGLEPPSR